MKPASPQFGRRLPRRRKRVVVVRKPLTRLSRVLLLARRWNWLGVLIVIAATTVSVWNGIAVGSRVVANPANLPEVLFGVGLLVVLALWWLPKGQAAWSQGAGIENRFDRENEARKTLAQIIGGVFLLAGLYSSTKTFDLQQQGQITDRYTKAIDQLGALAPGGEVDAEGRPKINLEVRLGGIYALERITKDSPKDQWTIMEVLTAYIRQNAPVTNRTKPVEERPAPSGTKQSLQGEPEKKLVVHADIQAILTVIGRRDTHHEPEGSRLDLSGANLVGVNLTKVPLARADLQSADLSGAELFEADLSKADLRGANLSKAHLTGADLREADLRGANLNNTHLAGAHLSVAHLFGAHLFRAILFAADLRDADLSWTDLSGADLGNANLDEANLSGADLREAKLTEANLRRANLSEAKNLTQRQLEDTIGDKATILPPGLEPFRPASWSDYK